jgi:hypothetical protein
MRRGPDRRELILANSRADLPRGSTTLPYFQVSAPWARRVYRSAKLAKSNTNPARDLSLYYMALLKPPQLMF